MRMQALGTVHRLVLRQRRTFVSKSLDENEAFANKIELLSSEATPVNLVSTNLANGISAGNPIAAPAVVNRPINSSSQAKSSGVTKWDRLYSSWAELSGEVELSRLKSAVADCSTQFDNAVRLVSAKRIEVDEAHRLHDDAQKNYSKLMMKRDHWDASDAALFIQLTSEEVTCRQQLQNARESLRMAEDGAGRYQRDYMDAMRRRYHEEQMWQDKWRVAGTFGTWSLIGLNTIIFMGGQYFHIRREKGRLEAIEDLINSKFPPVAVAPIDSGTVKDISTGVECPDPEGFVSVSNIDEIDELKNVDAKSSSTELSEDLKELQSSPKVVQKVQVWLSSTKNACAMLVKEIDWSAATKATDEVHWPSAFAGATIATTGFLLAIMLSKK